MLPTPHSLAGNGNRTCAKREMVATGSSTIARPLAKIDAEVAWEIKVVEKYGLLWYSWWAAKNHRFHCKTKGRRTTCVARGTPCRLL
jgi:hypothetical protein